MDMELRFAGILVRRRSERSPREVLLPGRRSRRPAQVPGISQLTFHPLILSIAEAGPLRSACSTKCTSTGEQKFTLAPSRDLGLTEASKK